LSLSTFDCEIERSRLSGDMDVDEMARRHSAEAPRDRSREGLARAG
jgi:hypothetical protein